MAKQYQTQKFPRASLQKFYATWLRPYVGRLVALVEDSQDWCARRLGRGARYACDIECDRSTLGHGDGRWCICPSRINERSVVYSVGVGYDISFDKALLQKFGCELHAFDPTDLSRQWIQTQKRPKGFDFHPLGLANYDGDAKFRLPPNHSVSFTPLDNVAGSQEHSCQVQRLQTIMGSLGHKHLDVLKIDIEGGEYELMEDIVEEADKIGQLLIEFHARMLGDNGNEVTEQAISKLSRAGFRLFNVSSRGNEFSFLGPRPLT